MIKTVNKYSLRMVKEKREEYRSPTKLLAESPENAERIIEDIFRLREEPEEVCVLLCLNAKNGVISAFEVSRGALSMGIMHPREIFKRAIVSNASSILLAHNHPSGDTTPSSEDIGVTKRIVEAGNIIGIRVIDHIIIGDSFISLKVEGHM